MATLIEHIDAEIARLQQARRALIGGSLPAPHPAPATRTSAPARHRLTPEGRKRISEAVARRWARQRAAKAKAKA